MMRKCLVITCIMLITLLACAKSGKNPKEGENRGTVDLSFAIWDSNQLPGMQAIVDDFGASHPNIKVSIQVTPWTEYWQKMRTSASNDTLPDVFWMHVMQFNLFAESDVLLPIDDQIRSSSMNINNFPKDLVDLYTHKNNKYAIPKDFDTIGLWYNKRLFDQAGLEYPTDDWTWDDLLENAKKLTDKEQGVYGFYMANSNQEGYWNFIYQNGGEVLTSDGKSGYTNPKTIEAVQWVADLALKHGVSPALADTLGKGFQWFQSGKIAMMLNGSWMVSALKNNEYTRANTDLVMLPKGQQRATMYNGLGYVISKSTKNPEEAWQFLEYLASEEANRIQAKYGAAIPAYQKTQQPWVDFTPDFNLGVYPQQLDIAIPYPQAPGQAEWLQREIEMMAQILSGKVAVEDGLTALAEEMNNLIESNR